MSNLFSSPDAFDFSQGLVFYHIKAAGCVCFSGAWGGGGGGGRTAGVPSHPGMPDRPASRESGLGKRKDAPASPSCHAVGEEETHGHGWPVRGLCSKPKVQPSSTLPLTHRHRSPGLAQDCCNSKKAEKRKLHLLQVHRNNFTPAHTHPPCIIRRSQPEGCG